MKVSRKLRTARKRRRKLTNHPSPKGLKRKKYKSRKKLATRV